MGLSTFCWGGGGGGGSRCYMDEMLMSNSERWWLNAHKKLGSVRNRREDLVGREHRVLTVETEVNGDSKSTNERRPSLVGSLG